MEPIFASLTSTLFKPSNSYSLLMRDFLKFVRIVMVDNDCFLVDFQGTVVDFTDTDTANVFVVIDGTD